MSTTWLNRVIGFSRVLLACLALSAGCSNGQSDTTLSTTPPPPPPPGTQPTFITEVHSATDTSTIPPGAPQSTSTLSLDVSGTNTLLLASWHAEHDGGAPNGWTVTSNGVPGTLIVDTDGYTGGTGNRRFRIYYWLNPPPGATTVVVTNPQADNTPNELAVSVVLLGNVAQTNPLGAIALDVSSSARTGERETVATTTNDLVVHVIADALFVRGTLGSEETSVSVANDGIHQTDGDASLWISTKPGEVGSTTVSSSGWASRVINGVAIVVHGSPTAVTLPVFPLVASGDQRYLQDQNNVPFPILGRTAWFITSLSVADYQTFIDDTASKGYNAIEFHVINHDPRGNNPPFGGNGALPFTTQLDGSPWAGPGFPDFTQPNETYWTYVDALLAYAESKGMLCFMFPAYVGFGGGDQGWMKEMVANGPLNMQAYGAWIATRYKNQKNLVWMAGGDMMTFDASQTAAEAALLTGLQSVANQQSIYFSAEWTRGSIATDQLDFGSQMTLNGTYANSLDINNQGLRAYSRTPTIPAFLLEEPYDEEGADGNSVNLDATQPVRRFQWWGVLSNIGGYISGNGCVWPFNSPNRSPFQFCQDGWQAHLNTQGAKDMARLNAFIKSIAWYNLVPSGLGGMKTLVTAGGSSPGSSDYVAAAATLDGTLLVAYVPPDHSGSITIDMTAMSGLTRARWFNPTTAKYTGAGVDLLFQGTMVFAPPGDNGTGFTDWVLLLEKQ